MRQQRWTLLTGDPFMLPVNAGDQYRFDHRGADGTIQSATVAATSDNEIVFVPGDTPRSYYVARRSGGEGIWQEIGVLDVKPLVDEDLERLRAELAACNAQIEDIEQFLQHEVTTPAGTALKRVDLNRILSARSKLEVRLAHYNRVRQGRLPARFG